MSNENSFDPQERRQETLENNGFSHYTAEIALGKVGLTSTADFPPIKTPPRRPHVSQRGGRSHPEESGRDVARRLANQDALEHPFVPTPESEEIKNAALASIRRNLRAQKIERIIAEENESYDPYTYDILHGEEESQHRITARVRTEFERDNK